MTCSTEPAAPHRGKPLTIVSDTGTELTSRAILALCNALLDLADAENALRGLEKASVGASEFVKPAVQPR